MAVEQERSWLFAQAPEEQRNIWRNSRPGCPELGNADANVPPVHELENCKRVNPRVCIRQTDSQVPHIRLVPVPR